MGDIGHLAGPPQQNAKLVSVSWNHNQEEPREAFKLTPVSEQLPDQRFAGLGYLHQVESSINSAAGGGGGGGEDPSSAGGCFGLEGQKVGEKRRTKMERMISLDVLQQHFAGSLKDAAKNIGVCPTTLKRICRQHGIRRWPSRKIKKVGHSLRKLQLVIDSVHGVQNVPIGSFYTNFPELGSLSISGNDHHSSLEKTQPETCSCIWGDGVAAAPSTSCYSDQNSGGPSTRCSGEACKQQNMGEDPGGLLKRAFSDAQLHTLNDGLQQGKLLARSQSEKTLLGDQYRIKSARVEGSYGVKATLGDVKIRFSLQPEWSFQELQREILRRFGIEEVSGINLKYLDDDHEWVLLTCDADLEECRDLHKSAAGGRTIKISIYHTQPHSRPTSFGTGGSSSITA